MDKNSKEKTPSGNLLVQLFFMLKTRSLAILASGKRKRVHFVQDEKQTLKKLKELRGIFLELSKEDLSRDTLFMEKIVPVWAFLEKSCSSLLETPCDPLTLEGRLRHLLLSIKHYPKKDPYNMGYYLTHSVGREWSPLPFMTMLRELHRDFGEQEASSSLAIWMQLLSEISDEFPG